MGLQIKICDTIEELEAAGPGAVFFPQPSKVVGVRCIILNCPGCGNRSAMDVYSAGEAKPPSPSWLMLNPPESLTLQPSINCVGCCKWHGWLTNGVFKSC